MPVFFFKQKTAYEVRISDWSSDVCSSDLGSERMDGMLQKLGLQEGEAIVHPWINRALAKAQQKVEERNFEIRKQLLKFDDVINEQRKVVYEQRREIMRAPDWHEMIAEDRQSIV